MLCYLIGHKIVWRLHPSGFRTIECCRCQRDWTHCNGMGYMLACTLLWILIGVAASQAIIRLVLHNKPVSAERAQ